MEFKTEAQKTCYEKVAVWMTEIFGEFSRTVDDAPVFIVNHGSAIVQVRVSAWSDDDAVINCRSYVVSKAELTPDLMRYLLNANDDFRFGAFGVDDDGDIFLAHSIVGSTCSKNELKTSAIAIVNTADKYDDEIVSRWGGQRALDR